MRGFLHTLNGGRACPEENLTPAPGDREHLCFNHFGSDMKNNGRFGFGIPKTIEIDICIISIENFEFHPLFGALF